MAFERVPGKERNYKNVETGEVISRRQYLKQLRGGLSNETYAQLNQVTNPKLSALRPARGRASALKKSETEKDLIAQARIEDKLKRAEVAAEEKARKELGKKLKKLENSKPVQRRHITGRLLKAGRYGARIPFQYYADYLVMFDEAKRGGKVTFYGLGMSGYHETTLQQLDVTVYTLRTFSRPVTEDDFNAAMSEALEERMYFVFQHYWMHLAFDKVYAAEKAAKAKRLPARKRKSRK